MYADYELKVFRIFFKKYKFFLCNVCAAKCFSKCVSIDLSMMEESVTSVSIFFKRKDTDHCNFRYL